MTSQHAIQQTQFKLKSLFHEESLSNEFSIWNILNSIVLWMDHFSIHLEIFALFEMKIVYEAYGMTMTHTKTAERIAG